MAQTLKSLDEIRGSALLRGYRGAPPSNPATLIDLLHRVSRLASDLPEIQELDLNPVMVMASGASVADARVRIEHPRPQGNYRRVAY